METVPNDQKQPKTTAEQEQNLKAHLMHNLEVRMNFEMYTYRLISADQFQQRNHHLAETLKFSTKPTKKITQ